MTGTKLTLDSPRAADGHARADDGDAARGSDARARRSRARHDDRRADPALERGARAPATDDGVDHSTDQSPHRADHQGHAHTHAPVAADPNEIGLGSIGTIGSPAEYDGGIGISQVHGGAIGTGGT